MTSEDRDIVLDTSAFEVDVLVFRRFAAGSGVAELEEAAKLYNGDFLDGLSFDSEGVRIVAPRRGDAFEGSSSSLDVLHRMMTKLAGAGETESAIETGTWILRLDPMHEAGVRRLMRLYDQSDRRGTAIQLSRNLAENSAPN